MRKNTGEASLEDAYKSELGNKEESNLYDDVNKKHELDAEQEKAEKVYKSDFKNREKTSENEKDEWEKLRKKDDAEKEKRAAELKEKEEFEQSYKRQFGAKNGGVDNTEVGNKEKNANDIDVPANNAPVDNESNLKKIIRERNENMPDKITADYLGESAEEIKERAKKEFPELVEIIEDEKKGIKKENAELKTENEQLKESMKEVNKQLFAIEDKLRDKIIEISAEEDKEKARKTITAIKKFLSKPKVKLAITVGLMGAAYTAGGGAPAILLFKPLLAKIGIGFIPYTYGISSWGGGAIAGASGRWFAEKIGLVKNKKDARDAIKEFAMDLKGAVNNENIEPKENNLTQTSEANEEDNQKSTVENNKEIDVVKIVEFVQEAKKRGMTAQQLLEGFNNDIELIDGTIETIKHEMSIFAFSKKKRDINAAHKWLREKRDEIEKLKLTETAVEPMAAEPVKTGETEKPEEKEASQEDIEKYQKDRIKDFDDLYEKAKKDEFDGKAIFKLFERLDDVEEKYKDEGKKITAPIRDHVIQIGKKDNLEIMKKMEEAMIKYKPRQVANKETSGEGAEKNKEKLSEAKDKFFSLARLIGNNKEKINTNILETLAELVNNEIEKGNYETVAPIVELAKDLVKNKEKFEFFDKAIITYNRDNIAKKKLVSEIKTHVLHMENNGLLGATAKEKEKNRFTIAALLDSEEFRNKI